MDVLKRLFEQHFHAPVERVQPLQGQLGGSGRNIIRLAGGNLSAIGILYPVREENVAFLEFSRHFRRHGLPVPEIYAEDLGQGAYLERIGVSTGVGRVWMSHNSALHESLISYVHSRRRGAARAA